MKEGRKPEYPEKTTGDELKKMPHTTVRTFKPKARLKPAQQHWWQARKADVLTATQTSPCWTVPWFNELHLEINQNSLLPNWATTRWTTSSLNNRSEWSNHLLFLLCSQLYFWGSPVFMRFLRKWPFFSPTIEVVTFRLRGYQTIWLVLDSMLVKENSWMLPSDVTELLICIATGK